MDIGREGTKVDLGHEIRIREQRRIVDGRTGRDTARHTRILKGLSWCEIPGTNSSPALFFSLIRISFVCVQKP